MADAMRYGFSHPLDVDLADYADDLVDGAGIHALEDHLNGCLLCRIKVRRLRDALHERSDASRSAASKSYGQSGLNADLQVLAAADSPVDTNVDQLEPGQLWAAGNETRVLLLILRGQHGRVFAAPVTFDAGAADEETVIVEASASPFAVSLAVYPMLAVEVPRSLLASCFGPLVQAADLDDLLAGALPGATRGQPIDGPTDPRLEFRQMLADHLGMLEEVESDPDTSADAPAPRPERIASALAVELRQRRELCRLYRLHSWEELVSAQSRGWTPLAIVDEVGTTLVVFDTPSGLANSGDFHAAMAVLTRFSATAVVVLATSLTSSAQVFDPVSLSYGIGVPSGEPVAPAPLLSGLAPADAIAKFLDQNSSRAEAIWSVRASTTPPDVIAALSRSAASAVADVAEQGRRAKIAPKAAGYASVEHLLQELDEVLRGAIDGGEVAQRLSDLAEGSER